MQQQWLHLSAVQICVEDECLSLNGVGQNVGPRMPDNRLHSSLLAPANPPSDTLNIGFYRALAQQC